MFCRQCGEANPGDANFCGRCGKELRKMPVPYKIQTRQRRVTITLALLFILTLGVYLSRLVFETPHSLPQTPAIPPVHEESKDADSLKHKIESIKDNFLKGKVIDFYLILTPQEIDEYLNEELFKKDITIFNSVHTELLNKDIELAFSTQFLYMPTTLRLRLRPVRSGEKTTLVTSGIKIGHLPIPHFLYSTLYERYPWLNPDYILTLSGIKLKEIKIENNSISLRGVWSI